MPVPSLSRGCEFAQFFVRHTATHRATGGSMAEESNPHAIKYASGEKLLEMSTERSAEELRHRYETFEKAVRMIASFASSSSFPSSGTNRQYYKPDQVKFESLRELINGSMPGRGHSQHLCM